MSDLYLIAHKVRGEPAFDIAEKIEDLSRDESWWLIPTSGHRAYPYWYIPLTDLNEPWGPIDLIFFAMPPDLRDHYEVSRDPPARDYTNRATQTPMIPTLEDI